MARLNAAWFDFTKRGQAWTHFWQDSAAIAASNTSYANTGSGTIKIAGSDPYSKKLVWTTSGQLIKIAGSSFVTKKMNYVPTGTLLISGTAFDRETFNYVPSGTISIGGSSLVIKTMNFPVAGTTIRISGTSFITKLMNYVPSGTIKISGSASDTEVFNYVSVGTVKISGTSLVTKVMNYVPTGTIRISGSVFDTEVFNYIPSGRIQLGGSALVTKVMNYVVPSGVLLKVSVGVTTPYSKRMDYKPDGIIILLAGTAPSAKTVNFRPSITGQEIMIAGSASVTKLMNYVASGTILVSGIAPKVTSQNYVPLVNKFAISGSAFYKKTFNYQTLISHAVLLSGQAAVYKKFVWSPSGNLQIGTINTNSTKRLVYLPAGFNIKIGNAGNYSKLLVWTPSGQLIKISGIAASSKAARYTYTPVGVALKISGTASITKKLVYSPASRALTISGGATRKSTMNYVVSGTIVKIAGSAITYQPHRYSYSVSPGLLKVAAAPSHARRFGTSATYGTIKIAGIATRKSTMNYLPECVVLVSGKATRSAKMVYISIIKRIALDAVGETYKKFKVWTPVGMLVRVSAPTTVAIKKFVYSPSGCIRVAASAPVRKTKKVLFSGRITLGQVQQVTYSKKRVYVITQVGTIRPSGAIQWYHRLKKYPTQVSLIKIAASALVTKKLAMVSRGRIIVSGNISSAVKKLVYLPSGRLTLGYSINTYSKKRIGASTTGTMRVSGSDPYCKTKSVIPAISSSVKVFGIGPRRATMNYIPGGRLQITSLPSQYRKRKVVPIVIGAGIAISGLDTSSLVLSPLAPSPFYKYGALGYIEDTRWYANTTGYVIAFSNTVTKLTVFPAQTKELIVPTTSQSVEEGGRSIAIVPSITQVSVVGGIGAGTKGVSIIQSPRVDTITIKS